VKAVRHHRLRSTAYHRCFSAKSILNRVRRGPCQTYALHEAHNDEKVTIAAEPYTQQMSGVFKENYWEHSLFPIRLLISNDSDRNADASQDLKIE